jgi:cysteinyl-tRNA synthetase
MSCRFTGAILILIFLSGLLTGCKPAAQEPDWAGVDNFLYQLQRADPDRIGETAFDLAVVTLATAGSSPHVIPALRDSPGGPKIILCYMSIGQSETYRWYWDPNWETNPPTWLDVPDGIWAGDHWVHYWDPGWQSIIYGTSESYLDQIIALGFDQGRDTAAREMVDFILKFTEYARRKHPGFGVFPQNAEELGVQFPDYMDAMTGIGVEDLYYGYPRDHEPSPTDWTAEREVILDQWVAAGKLVLTIDYTARPEQIADAYFRSHTRGYVPYVTDRSLGRLRINPGFEPDKDPSEWVFSTQIP